jgi:hypothetical protein
MPATQPPAALLHDFADDPAAQNYVNAAALQAQFLAILAYLEDQFEDLEVSIRDDNTLTDELVRIRNLHAELSSFLTGSVLTSTLTRLANVDVATTEDVALTGEQDIDGISTSASRILVKDQTDPIENGIYVTDANAWTRATDLPAAATQGAFAVIVEGGTVHGEQTWGLLVGSTGAVVGTDELPFFNLFPVTAGPTGAAGADGNTILNGTTVPSDEDDGVDGDFYLRTTTSMLYGPKASGAWLAGVSLVGATGAAGATGATGAAGNTILSGTAAPGNELGTNGDFYLDTVASKIYGPKAAGTWPAGVSLIGATGAAGAAGASGVAVYMPDSGPRKFTCPVSGDYIIDICGGGGGGAGNNVGGTGGGSGGGGFRKRVVKAFTKDVEYPYTIGSGGNAGTIYGNGGDGGTSTINGVSGEGGKAGTSTDSGNGRGDPPGTTNCGGRNPTVNVAGETLTGQGGAGAATGGTVGFAGAKGWITVQLLGTSGL